MERQHNIEALVSTAIQGVAHFLAREISKQINLASPPPPKQEEILTIKEAAALIRRRPKTIYRLVAQGKIPCSKVEGRLVFFRSELLAWLHEGNVATCEELAAEATHQLLHIRKVRKADRLF